MKTPIELAREAGFELSTNPHWNTQFRCFSTEIERLLKHHRQQVIEELAGMGVEPFAVSLTFGTDPRLNLSTIFYTELEAIDYATSCSEKSNAKVVALYPLEALASARVQERGDFLKAIKTLIKEPHGWNSFSYTCAINDVIDALRNQGSAT